VRREVRRTGAFRDREFDDHPDDERPHQGQAVLGAGNGGGHHVAYADAGGRQQQPRSEVGELHEAAIVRAKGGLKTALYIGPEA